MTVIPSSGNPGEAACTQADIAILQRLAELGMRLAEHVAAQALQDPEPEGQPAAPPRRRRADPILLFTRLARAVRDTIALKTRIAGTTPRAQSPAAAHTRKDPRRPFIDAEFDRAVATSAYPKIDRPALRREIDDRLTDALSADPDRLVAGGEFVITICNEFGLDYDVAQFADELLVPPGAPLPGQGPILRQQDDLSRISRAGQPQDDLRLPP